MDIDVFTEFAMVAKHCNLSEASKELHVAESVLSRHITALEKEYGVTLFDRAHGHMELTLTGRKALEIAARITNEGLRFRQLRAFERQHARALRVVGTIDTTLLARLRRAARAHDTALDFTGTSTQTPFDQLRAGIVDIAVEPLSDLIDTHDLAWEVVAREPAYLVLERTNPLARRGSFDAADLSALDFTSLRTNEGNAVRKHLQDVCRRAGMIGDIPGHLTLSQAENYDQLFMYGLEGSVIMLPKGMALRYAADYADDCVARPFVGKDADFVFCAFYRDDAARVVRSFAEALAKDGDEDVDAPAGSVVARGAGTPGGVRPRASEPADAARAV